MPWLGCTHDARAERDGGALQAQTDTERWDAELWRLTYQ